MADNRCKKKPRKPRLVRDPLTGMLVKPPPVVRPHRNRQDRVHRWFMRGSGESGRLTILSRGPKKWDEITKRPRFKLLFNATGMSHRGLCSTVRHSFSGVSQFNTDAGAFRVSFTG